MTTDPERRTKNPELKIVQIPVARLIPYARNAKLHSDEQVAQIAASIQEFGFNNPVLLDGKLGIIAGHGRVLAARKLGLNAVPCIRLAHLTQIQKRAYILADNRLGEIGGGWDPQMLQVEIDALRTADFNVASTGWDDAGLAEVLSKAEFTDDPAAGEGGAGDDTQADTMLVIGQFRIPITRKRYVAWLERLRQRVGFDDPAVEKEILRRLRL